MFIKMFRFLCISGTVFVLSAFGVFCFSAFNTGSVSAQQTQIATTSVEVIVNPCGDGVIYPGQECDDGEENNIGEYSITIEGRTCTSDCVWAPYCGDGNVQTSYGEECDDGTNTDEGFCDDECKIRQPPEDPPDGGGGGGGGGGSYDPGSDEPIGETSVTVEGKAYPNSNVNILQDGNVIGVVSSDSRANFTFTTDDVTPGSTTMGFWAEDRLGLRSISYTVTFDISEGASNVVSGVFIPPTIDMDSNEIDPGEVVEIFGTSAPEADVEAHIHSEAKMIEKATSSEDGSWKVELDSTPLETGQHTARAMFEVEEDGSAHSSSFSRAKTFFVGVSAEDALTADLNNDGKVNIADFSILLFHWGSSDPTADINNDGSAGLADFSIMLFQWTG